MKTPHAIVIGAGFGGLAAAVRLAVKGYDVTVLERRDAPGGRAYVYRQDGFVFDGGPTVLTAPWLFEELWSLCGRRLQDDVTLVAVDPFYRICFDDGSVFEYTGDRDRMRAEIAKFSPADVAGWERFLEMSRAIFEVGFDRLSDVPFDSWRAMARIVPDMVRLRSYRSVYGLVSSFVKHDKIRQVLSFHPLLVGGNPFATTSIYTLIAHLEQKWGVHFAMGGTGQLVSGLVSLLEGQGGALRCGAEVAEIVVERGRACAVRLADGERIAADLVVSNADAAWTYGKLLPAATRRRWTDRRLARARYSMSLFVWYFGTNRRYDEVAHHTIALGPRYRGLLDDIFVNKRLAHDFSLYLHRPTATDPSLAPAGCDAFYVLAPVPHLDSGVDWQIEAEPYRRAVARVLERTLLPGLEAAVVSSHMLTPLGFREELLSPKGAAFSFEPVLWQSAYFRPHNRSEDVAGLYLVGAGTHPGAGVPGVLSSAKVLERLIPPVRGASRGVAQTPQ